MHFSSLAGRTLKKNSFVQRGNSFFRVHGDGVLQVVKYEYERNCGVYELRVGLFSLYSELLPQWFTSRGCIPRYSVYNIVGQRYGPSLVDSGITIRHKCAQEDILLQDGIPWLNSITTQHQLVDGIYFLETNWGGGLQLVDSLKIAPYMCCGYYESAKKIIESILNQHMTVYQQKKETYSKDEYKEYIESRLKEDRHYQFLLNLIEARNFDGIKKYLDNNFNTNSVYASFCMR